MAKNQMFTFECDLCATKSTSSTHEVPKGWVEISVDDPFLDRSWHEKAVCRECVKLIQQRLKQREAQ